MCTSPPFVSHTLEQVIQAATVYLKISVLIRLAKEARNAALKAWSDALSPLDRKLELYGTALRDWHAGTGPLATAKANLLALVVLSCGTRLQTAKF